MAGLTGLKGRSDCREALGRADLRWVSPGGSVAWWSSAGGAGVAAAVQLSGESQDLRRAQVGGSSLRGADETDGGEAAERWRGWGGAASHRQLVPQQGLVLMRHLHGHELRPRGIWRRVLVVGIDKLQITNYVYIITTLRSG